MREFKKNIHEDIILKCQKNDQNAQHDLYKLYSKAMYHVCVRMIGNSADAEDLLQEVFIKLFRNIKSFRGDCSFGLWARRITINYCVDHLRKKRLFFLDLEQCPQDELIDDTVNLKGITVEMIHESIKELPNGCRVVLVMYLLEKIKHRDIANQLGISVSTSKSQYQRGLSLLRTKLERYHYEEQI